MTWSVTWKQRIILEPTQDDDRFRVTRSFSMYIGPNFHFASIYLAENISIVVFLLGLP